MQYPLNEARLEAPIRFQYPIVPFIFTTGCFIPCIDVADLRAACLPAVVAPVLCRGEFHNGLALPDVDAFRDRSRV
jgi:hypothetical protein